MRGGGAPAEPERNRFNAGSLPAGNSRAAYCAAVIRPLLSHIRSSSTFLPISVMKNQQSNNQNLKSVVPSELRIFIKNSISIDCLSHSCRGGVVDCIFSQLVMMSERRREGEKERRREGEKESGRLTAAQYAARRLTAGPA